MTNNELIKELVVYDGYVYFETVSVRYFHKEGLIYHYSDLHCYLTDMNIMHRIAVKVVNIITKKCDKLDDIDWDLADCNSKIVSAMFTSPNSQGEHINLATALVNAIRYISANKA